MSYKELCIRRTRQKLSKLCDFGKIKVNGLSADCSADSNCDFCHSTVLLTLSESCSMRRSVALRFRGPSRTVVFAEVDGRFSVLSMKSASFSGRSPNGCSNFARCLSIQLWFSMYLKLQIII